jgi:hypothetical protein
MGIRMDDLHAPTVSSGPTTGGYANGVPKEQLSLQELMAEKDRVETELKALGHVLDSVRFYSAASPLRRALLMPATAWRPHEHRPHDL